MSEREKLMSSTAMRRVLEEREAAQAQERVIETARDIVVEMMSEDPHHSNNGLYLKVNLPDDFNPDSPSSSSIALDHVEDALLRNCADIIASLGAVKKPDGSWYYHITFCEPEAKSHAIFDQMQEEIILAVEAELTASYPERLNMLRNDVGPRNTRTGFFRTHPVALEEHRFSQNYQTAKHLARRYLHKLFGDINDTVKRSQTEDVELKDIDTCELTFAFDETKGKKHTTIPQAKLAIQMVEMALGNALPEPFCKLEGKVKVGDGDSQQLCGNLVFHKVTNTQQALDLTNALHDSKQQIMTELAAQQEHAGRSLQ